MKKISKSELEIMELLWQAAAPMSAAQIVEAACAGHDWSDKTVKTFLNRLRGKGALRVERGSVFLFSPAFSREEMALAQVNETLQNLYGGSFKRMAAQFIEGGALSEEDIRDLRDYLNSIPED